MDPSWSNNKLDRWPTSWNSLHAWRYRYIMSSTLTSSCHIRRQRPMAHFIHNPHQWLKKVKKSIKLNQSLIVGDMDKEGNDNILYTERDTPTSITHGSTTRTYTHQNFSKSTSLIPLWLDNQMFKRHLNVDNFPILSLNTTTMSSTYSPTASVHNYPSRAISPWNAF